MRKEYKIVLIIVLIILVGLGVYFGIQYLTSEPFSQPDSSTTTNPGGVSVDVDDTQDPDDTTDTTDDEGYTPVLMSDEENQVFDFWTNPDTEEVGYITTNGLVYKALSGPDEEVSSQEINALNFIKQSPSGEYILTAFGDPKNPNWGIFDTIDQVWRPLPGAIEKAVWSESDNEIIIIVNSGNNRVLGSAQIENGTLSESDLNVSVIISDFRLRDINLETVRQGSLFVSEKTNNEYPGKVWEININTGSINNIMTGEVGLITKWDNDFIFKHSQEGGFDILNYNLSNAAPVFFNTLPSKCAQVENSTSTIYCGAPETLESRQLPESYLKKSYFTIDNLYEISAGTPDAEELFQSNQGEIPAMDIKNPRSDGESLYFINRYDQGLYKVSL